MQLHRNHGFQQNQCYGIETQQESYEVHEETWSSRNGHHSHFPGMRMANDARADSHDFQRHHGNGMFGEGRRHYGSSSGHQGNFSGGHNLSFGGAPPFSNGPKNSQHLGHARDYFSEVNKYEMHNGASKVMVEEMRYKRHNWGGGDDYCANPCDRNMNNRFHKVEWEVKGV